MNDKDSSTTHTAHIAGNYYFSAYFHSSWIIDSGASNYICYELNSFTSYKTLQGKSHYITMPDGRKTKVHIIGNVILPNGFMLKKCTVYAKFSIQLTVSA